MTPYIRANSSRALRWFCQSRWTDASSRFAVMKRSMEDACLNTSSDVGIVGLMMAHALMQTIDGLLEVLHRVIGLSFDWTLVEVDGGALKSTRAGRRSCGFNVIAWRQT